MRKREVREIVDKNSRTYWQNLINEWVHDETDRFILSRFLLDGCTLDKISAELHMEYKNLYARYKKAINQLLQHTDI